MEEMNGLNGLSKKKKDAKVILDRKSIKRNKDFEKKKMKKSVWINSIRFIFEKDEIYKSQKPIKKKNVDLIDSGTCLVRIIKLKKKM